MNRHERRKKKVMNRMEHRNNIKSGIFYVGVPQDVSHLLRDGDKFTAKGHKWLSNGLIFTNCAPGEETVFTARVVKDE